jgi:hypothetical protein
LRIIDAITEVIRWTGFALAMLLFALTGLAQSEEDVLRIRDIHTGGTGRSSGIANAFGALGADAAAVTINPGSMGLYRTSEFSLTPAFEVNEAASTFNGNTAADTRSKFNFTNVGIVINNPSEKGNIFSSTFGLVFDRQASHQWRSIASADNTPSSILDGFVNEANGTPEDLLLTDFPFTSGLAWEAYGIDPWTVLDPNGDTIPNQYVSAIPIGSGTSQMHTIETKGSSTSTSIFYSANYKDKLYFGATVGIVSHRFTRTTVHKESALDEGLDFIGSTYREDLTTTGNGADIKLGVVGRVGERVRLGAAIHSPQWMQFNDGFVTDFRTNFRTPDINGRSDYSAESPEGLFAYGVNTEWRAVLSAAYFAGSNGLVSVDYEYSDPRKSRFRSSDELLNPYDFALENSIIAGAFRQVHSVRVGTEWRQGSWYYRLGWGVVPNAFRVNEARHAQAMKTYAGGIGFRKTHFSVDLGLNYVSDSRVYFQYDPTVVEPTVEARRSYRAMLTFGFRI